VPPFGHATQLRVFVDPDLLQYDEVWAAAGTWNDNFGAAPSDIVRVGDFDHATVVYHAVPLVQEWFGRLVNAPNSG
jgi:prolyl-tRNA editing enzyme YbaK/EbsC (Cys-tRNA(Pro) deacylase)